MWYIYRMRTLLVTIFVLMAGLASAQEPSSNVASEQRIQDLEERLSNAIKGSVSKDEELARLKTQLSRTPENIDKYIRDRVTDLNQLKQAPSVRACKKVGGKALITTNNDMNQLVYAGCLL